jgi:hypothetical protein
VIELTNGEILKTISSSVGIATEIVESETLLISPAIFASITKTSIKRISSKRINFIIESRFSGDKLKETLSFINPDKLLLQQRGRERKVSVLEKSRLISLLDICGVTFSYAYLFFGEVLWLIIIKKR